MILTDDQGWGDLSVHGNTNLKQRRTSIRWPMTGLLFERFFVCPVCSPHAGRVLGLRRYHPRGGVWDVSTGGERLNLDERTIADTFHAAGYATAAFGKWHNGAQYPYHPRGRGFDEFYGFCSGHWGDYFDPPLEHNGELVRGNGFIADDFTDRALAFLEAQRDRSFFCYLPLNTPHSPMQVPDRFWAKFQNQELKMRHEGPQAEDVAMTRAALAMCENIDWNVGRKSLAKLDELKLAENTIVIYFADNGPNSARWNGGMKGAQRDDGRRGRTFAAADPLAREGFLPARRSHKSPGMAIDLLPTLAELARRSDRDHQ